MKATVLDGISRELSEESTRRSVLRLLGRATAVAAVGAIGARGLSETAAAKRRGRKRGKHSRRQPEVSQTQLDQTLPPDADPASTAKIGPNCIYVCCDGTCDSWTMCMKCVKWPDPPPTTVAVAE